MKCFLSLFENSLFDFFNFVFEKKKVITKLSLIKCQVSTEISSRNQKYSKFLIFCFEHHLRLFGNGELALSNFSHFNKQFQASVGFNAENSHSTSVANQIIGFSWCSPCAPRMKVRSPKHKISHIPPSPTSEFPNH